MDIPVTEWGAGEALTLRNGRSPFSKEAPCQGVLYGGCQESLQSPGYWSQWGPTPLPVWGSSLRDSPCLGGWVPSLWVQVSLGVILTYPPGGSVFCDDAASLSACLGMTKPWTQWEAALPQHHTVLSPSLLHCKTRVPGCPAPTGGAPVSGAGERKGALPQAAPGGSWSKKQAPRGMRAGRTAGWEGPTGQDRPHLRGPGKGVS